MKKLLFLIAVLLITNSAYAENIQITPVKKITTATKYFQEGNIYQFRDIRTNEILTGTVIYYPPNGIMGQNSKSLLQEMKTEIKLLLIQTSQSTDLIYSNSNQKE